MKVCLCLEPPGANLTEIRPILVNVMLTAKYGPSFYVIRSTSDLLART
jgi:hypothetical protein